MPTAIQFGAGAIGRGFVGQLFSEGGLEVVFVDVAPEVVAGLNATASGEMPPPASRGSLPSSV